MEISPKLSKMIQKLWKIMIAEQLVVFRPKEADLGRKRADRTKIELKSNSSRRQHESDSRVIRSNPRLYSGSCRGFIGVLSKAFRPLLLEKLRKVAYTLVYVNFFLYFCREF